MKKHLQKTLIATACGLAMSAGTQAATVAFEYADPGEFLDIHATDQSQKKFEESVMRELEKQFREEAEALPEGQTLQVTVKDVDLAGDIEYFHRSYPFGLRVVRNVDFPRLEFSYVLRDENGAVISSGDENISDLGFRDDILVQRNMDPLDYEKEMISEWYDKTFD
jgi:hypothetical protein